MRDYVIIVDSAADFDKKLENETKLRSIQFMIALDKNVVPDISFINMEEFYFNQKKGTNVSVYPICEDVFTEVFQYYLEMGKDILYISVSSELSNSIEAAKEAKCKLLTNNEGRIEIFDSRTASIAEGLLVEIACSLKDSGATLDDTVEELYKMREKLAQWFLVDDLYYLKRGGKYTGNEKMASKALKVKLIMSITDEGKTTVRSRARGIQNAMEYLIEKIQEDAEILSDNKIVIGHTGCLEKAEKLSALFAENGFSHDVSIIEIGPYVGAFVGQGMLAVTYCSKK